MSIVNDKCNVNSQRCSVANKSLNVLEWVRGVERNKDGPLCCPADCRYSVSVKETEAVAQRCSVKKMFLEISQKLKVAG